MKKILTALFVVFFSSLFVGAQPLKKRPPSPNGHHTQYLPGVNERRMARLEKMRQANITRRHQAGPRRAKTQPEIQRGLVLLVQFSDVMMKSGAATQWDNRFNQQGFSLNNHVGSVRDYFVEQSYGLLTIDFDVVGPITLSKKREYYGSSPNQYLDDRAPEMVIEALKLADSEINFSDYDWDGDGEVDQVFIIFAGITKYGVSGYIWPHEWCLSNAKYYGSGSGRQKLDNTYIDTYAVSNELANASTFDGIGTACHEFSHCLGFPDFYDVDYSGGTGGQNWDLLDGGSYNGPKGNGEVPSPYTAYERWSAGWIDLIPLTEPCRVTDMPAINEQGVAYIITNTGNSNEYYILENRQRITFGTGNRGHGLMVWHIDYSPTAWANNSVNTNKSHQRMTFLPADEKVGDLKVSEGYYQYQISSEDEAGDPYPGFTNTTSVKQLTWFTKEKGGTKNHQNLIHDISETADGKINFTYGDFVALPTPELAMPTDITEESFVANWLPVEGATSYVLQVEAITGEPTPVSILTEDFSGFSNVTANAAVSNSVVNNYTQAPGWTVSGLYGMNADCVRLSTAKIAGYITTPVLGNRAGTLIVEFDASDYELDDSSVEVSVLNGGQTIATMTVALVPVRTTYSCTFEDIPSDCHVKFASTEPGKRFNLYNVNIMDVSGPDCETATYTGLTTTSFVIETSDAEMYYYRVQAICDDGASEWSDWVDVDIASEINEMTGKKAFDGEIYDLAGRRLPHIPERGFYIRNGKTYMVR